MGGGAGSPGGLGEDPMCRAGGLGFLWVTCPVFPAHPSVGGAGAQHTDPVLGSEALGSHDHEQPGGAGLLPGLPASGAGHAEQQPEPRQVRALPNLPGQPHVRHLPQVSSRPGAAPWLPVRWHAWGERGGGWGRALPPAASAGRV